MRTHVPVFGRPIKEIGDCPKVHNSTYAFVFSDDIKDWIGRGIAKREKNKIAYKEKSKRQLDYKRKHG